MVKATKLRTSPIPTLIRGRGMRNPLPKHIRNVKAPHNNSGLPSLAATLAIMKDDAIIRIQISNKIIQQNVNSRTYSTHCE